MTSAPLRAGPRGWHRRGWRRRGDRVRLISYNGKVTHVSYARGDSATGGYGDATDGYTWMLWIAVPLLTSTACLTVILHRTGEFEGYLLFASAAVTALFGVTLSMPLRMGLGLLMDAAPTAFVGAALIAAATTAGWIKCTGPD